MKNIHDDEGKSVFCADQQQSTIFFKRQRSLGAAVTRNMIHPASRNLEI